MVQPAHYTVIEKRKSILISNYRKGVENLNIGSEQQMGLSVCTDALSGMYHFRPLMALDPYLHEKAHLKA